MDVGTIITWGGYVIAGILAIVGAFNLQRQAQRTADDQTAANLIQNLKTTTELQEKEITRLRDKEAAQGKELAHLQGQLTMLKEIFQGRDPEMQEFLKTVPQLMIIAHENNGLAKAQADALAALTSQITALVVAITPPKPATS